MMVKLPKSNAGEQAPSSWWLDCWGDGEGRVIVMACDQGHVSTIYGDRGAGTERVGRHTISASGEVNPSVVCPHPGCKYHEIAKLEGWEPALIAGGDM